MRKHRHSKIKLDPITGISYERGSLMDIASFKNTNNYSRKKKNYYRKTDFEQLPPEAWAIGGIFTLLILIYIFVILPAINYIKEHILIFSSLGIILIVCLIIGLVIYVKMKIQERKEKELFEKQQIEKGLIKFIDRFNNERWGKPEEVSMWAKEDEKAKEKEKLINKIIAEIEEFKPIRKYHYEFPYQIDLARHIKTKFPDADIEEKRGHSRPDIVVGDVAIEVKGPTGHRELDSIATKCMKYKEHFGEVIIVLFDVIVNEGYYLEWITALNKNFPNIKVIRK